MSWIAIDHIQCLRAVVEEGSFNRAGEKIQRAKSAVRYGVNTLEDQLGYPLLDRKSYRPVATAQGRAFLRRAEKLLEAYDDLRVYSRQIADRIESRLVISASGLYELTTLYPVLHEAMQAFPSTEIVLERELLSGERMLLQGTVDLAIFESFRKLEELESKSLGTIRMIPVMASSHPFLSLPRSRQTPERLYQYPQIVQRSTIPEDELQFSVHKNSLKWRVADTPSKREIIAFGLGWGSLPEHLIRTDLESGLLSPLEVVARPSEVEVCLGRRKSGFIGQVSRYIWNSFES
jgi:DNA-binding transcriptional LysR family regulator